MSSRRLRQADEELIRARNTLGAAQDQLVTANQAVSAATRIEYPILTNLSFDRSKDQNWDEATRLGLDDNGDDTGAARAFVYKVLELSVDVEINEGGNVTILAVNGVTLDKSIEM